MVFPESFLASNISCLVNGEGLGRCVSVFFASARIKRWVHELKLVVMLDGEVVVVVVRTVKEWVCFLDSR